jgi:lysophospholipase L1-like esterase
MHLVVVNAAGKTRLIVGEPGLGIQLPPEKKADETHLATVWLSGKVKTLTEANLLPVDGTPVPTSGWEGSAETLCPKTLGKLRAGEPVTIVAWGDSVTHGGGVRSSQDAWYQHVFLKRLQARFPRSEITLHTAAWPGGNSRGYMGASAGGKYDFKRDVLDPKPDLVTIEFVNDAGWKGDGLKQHYTKIREILQGNGSEIILITPHFVRPDWMGVSSIKFDDDPRPYVQGLREFARENRLPLADASLYWGHLWREGIPYMTLLGNSINHPDERGHRFFADALMGVFPEK